MLIEDVSDESHSSRVRSYLMSLYGKDGTTPHLTIDELNHANQMATVEMLEEIHCMLRQLTKQ